MKAEIKRECGGRYVSRYEGSPREWMKSFIGRPPCFHADPVDTLWKFFHKKTRRFRYYILSTLGIIPPLEPNKIYYIVKKNGDIRKVEFYNKAEFGFGVFHGGINNDIRMMSLRDMAAWYGHTMTPVRHIARVGYAVLLKRMKLKEAIEYLTSHAKKSIKNYVNTKL